MHSMPIGAIAVDTKIDGFVARKLPSGKVSYGFRYRDHTPNPKVVEPWSSWAERDYSRDGPSQGQGHSRQRGSRKGPDAPRSRRLRDKAEKAKLAGKNTVNAVLDLFIARHVKNLRSAKTVERCLEVYVRPRIGSKSIYGLKRRDIVDMLDAIEDADLAVTADRVLAYVRKAFNWYAARDDEFTPPIVRGMARTKPSERARTRALADDEICSLWTALESTDSPEPFRAMVRVLLLTAQRKNEIGLMRAEEIDGDTLVIPAERYKTGVPNAVPLTKEARQWIGDRKAGFMFSSTAAKSHSTGTAKPRDSLMPSLPSNARLPS